MSEIKQPINIEEQTKMISKEVGILPDTKVFRWLHPGVICGVVGGQILLRGNNSNGTAIVDEYGNSPERKRASALKNPGLNFTHTYSDNYQNDKRRVAVSLRMDQQPKGLQLYPDVGSEIKSIYFTLPVDSFFHVSAEKLDPIEVAIALNMRSCMNRLGVIEEPDYLHWLDSGEGVRLVTYLPKPERGEQRVEITFFSEKDNSYRIDTAPFKGLQNREEVERMAVYRFLLENRDFSQLLMADGSIHSKDDLLRGVTESKQFAIAKSLEK